MVSGGSGIGDNALDTGGAAATDDLRDGFSVMVWFSGVQASAATRWHSEELRPLMTCGTARLLHGTLVPSAMLPTIGLGH